MIKRDIIHELKKHLLRKEITLLVGPRQSGKTYLMQALNDMLGKQGKKTIFLNLDFEDDRQFFTSQTALLHKIKLHLSDSSGYVFIDEIQRKENAGIFLKGLYDMNLPYKFVVSGSGSLELKERIHESLAGRKRVFDITPLTFTEFINFKTNYHFEERLIEFFTIEKTKTIDLFHQYLKFGGYPRVILATTVDEKRAVMGEIYQSYLERDIKSLLNIEKTEALTQLVKILASQIGGPVNISELSATIGIANRTVQKYLWYLEKTFIIKRVTPYFRNVRKEITKAPLYYFYDLGLRNYILGLFGVELQGSSGSHLFENFILNRIQEQILFLSTSTHFWRSRDGAEVDFVVTIGTDLVPVEVKYTNVDRFQVTRSLRSFIHRYHPQHAYIVHMGEAKKTEVHETLIRFVPFYQSLSFA